MIVALLDPTIGQSSMVWAKASSACLIDVIEIRIVMKYHTNGPDGWVMVYSLEILHDGAFWSSDDAYSHS
jgi:hypothetical protein